MYKTQIPKPLLVQVVLIGDAGVGKTCAVQRFKHGVYIERHGNTIGVDFVLKTVEVNGSRIKVRWLATIRYHLPFGNCIQGGFGENSPRVYSILFSM